MIEHGRQLEDGQRGRGSVNAVLRVGNTVVRPAGDWSPAVHALLNHLEEAGFPFSPRVLGVQDSPPAEVLTYLDGEVSMRPWPPCLCSTEGIVAIAQMLRAYHDAVQSFRPSPDSIWRNPEAAWREGQIVRHGDLGPWNMVWTAGTLTGLIDWDLAEPGEAIEDVAQVAWACIPLRPPGRCVEAGVKVADQAPRLAALCTTYGAQPAEVLQALLALQDAEIATTQTLGDADVEPWTTFLGRGDVPDIRRDRGWLRTHWHRLAESVNISP